MAGEGEGKGWKEGEGERATKSMKPSVHKVASLPRLQILGNVIDY